MDRPHPRFLLRTYMRNLEQDTRRVDWMNFNNLGERHPVTISLIQASSKPTSGLPANILTSSSNQLWPRSGWTTRSSHIFNHAGRRLPGMPGSPPLKSPMGAQDPTADYITTPAVGPLFCVSPEAPPRLSTSQIRLAIITAPVRAAIMSFCASHSSP